jgi:hypothetical protein
MGPRPKTNRKLGPPTKKNEAIIKRLIAAARLGLRCLGRIGEPVRALRMGGTGTARRSMSIKVRLGPPEVGLRQENRPKIRVRLPGTNGAQNGHSLPRLPALVEPEPIPERIKRFWDFDEDAHRARKPWRYVESPDEQSMREQAENNGAWAG